MSYRIYILWLISAVLFTSCFSSTKYIGHHTLISSLDDGKKIAYLDYTELGATSMEEKYASFFDYYSAEYADFDLQICSMEKFENVKPDCIRRCKEAFGADLVIVSSRVSCREGLLRQKKSAEDEFNPYITNKTQDIGIIHFSMFDTHLAEELISFKVRTKSSGLKIQNKDDSSTTINPSTCNYVLSKARRKGIKKIIKQLE